VPLERGTHLEQYPERSRQARVRDFTRLGERYQLSFNAFEMDGVPTGAGSSTAISRALRTASTAINMTPATARIVMNTS